MERPSSENGTRSFWEAVQRPMTALAGQRLLALLLPLTVGLLFSRAWKLISVGLIEDAVWGISVRRRVLQTVLVVFGLIGLVVVAKLAARRGIKVWRWLLALAALGIAAGELRERLTTHQSWLFIDRLWGRALMQVHVFRADLTLIAGFGLIAAFMLSGRWGNATWRYRTLQAIAVVILLLAGIELAYFKSTGNLGDGFIFMFWLQHLGSIGFLVKNQMDLGNVATLLLYPLLAPLGAWLVARSAAGARLAAAWEKTPIALATPAILLALWLAPDHYVIAYPYKRISSQFHGRLAADIASRLLSDPGESVSNAKVLADFRHLHFKAGAETRKLNVVFIILESVRAESTTPYNAHLMTTPFLRDLASKSLVIEDMNAVIPQTSKAWTAIFTGMYPVSTMVSSFSEASSATTSLPSLPALLAEHGYRSAFFTPAHLKFDNDSDVIRNRKFDVVKSETDLPTEGFERSNYYGYEDRIMLQPSMEWVDQISGRGEPFFLSYMTLTGHHDYQVPKSYPKQRYPDVSDDTVNDYLNCLHYIDDWLRDLFAAFEKRGLLDKTVFFILGDHGQSFGEHGARQHVSVVYEEATHVPALVYAPALWPQGGRIAGPRQQIDLLPSVANVLGYTLEGGHMPGQSLLAPVPSGRKLYFTCWQERTCIGMRDGSLKYIYWYETDVFQAFDLSKDPRERDDFGSKLPKDQVRKLRDEMATWQASAVQTYLASH